MSPSRRPVSLVAERAVRYLSEHREPVGSIEMASRVLATKVSDEATARRVLEAAFAGDPRLRYDGAGWKSAEGSRPPGRAAPGPEPDRVLLLLQGRRPEPGQPFQVNSMAVVRVKKDEVISACGGALPLRQGGSKLRKTVREILDGAIPVLHDPPGALAAIERWLGEPLEAPVSLRVLATRRLGLKANHDLEALAARLKLPYRDADELLDQAELLDACLQTLRRSGENLEDLRDACGEVPRLDWSRFLFDRDFVRNLPRVPGTYRFYGEEERLLYVGKSKNLHDRVGWYFREGAPRPARVQKLLDCLRRIEVEPVGSDLEALLQEAALIRRRKPETNVQRVVRVRGSRRDRMRSVLILEPASRPWVLRAYLLRDGSLVGKVGIGPRGAGLRRVERLLEDHFFGIPLGPTETPGPQVEVEVISRWLAANRDRVVAFDPNDLGSGREVVQRLRWFLDHGSLLEPDGTPILTR